MRSTASQCPFDHREFANKLSPNGCPISIKAAEFNPFEPSYMQAPADYLRWSRESEPVFWSPQLGYWVVTRYEDVKAVFRDNILFSPSIALEKITPATPEVMKILKDYGYAVNRTMVNEDEPEHMERRRLLMDAFLPDQLITYEPMVRSLARQYMDRFIDKGRADLVREMFYEIPLNIALKFLGVPDNGADQLRRFAVAHTLNTWGKPTAQEQLVIAENVGKFWQTAQNILDQMMLNPSGQGWMYDSIRQHLKHPSVVTKSYLRSMMLAILAAAHETTSNATANAFLTLLTQRRAWDDICNNPALIPNAVEECLRVSGSIIAWRRIATADAVVGGISIPKGGKILLVQASANFDSLHFENPNEVDVYRESAVEHLTFGYGAHQCMGKNIGRMQMRVFLEEFVQRIPHMRLVQDQKFEYLSNTSFRGPSALWVEWDPALNPERIHYQELKKLSKFYIGPPAKDGLTRTVIVREKQKEARDIYRFVLVDPKGSLLPSWTAGSHIDLISGEFRRRYSLCGDADDRTSLQVVIQREDRGRGGSRYFCDELNIGDELQLLGPKNLFKLDESAKHFVLIAAGIGITPILSMATRLKKLGKSYEIHYAARAREQMALLAELQADHQDQLKLYIKSEGSRMALPTLLNSVDSQTRVYACGPERLINELETMSERWPAQVLHYELFNGDGVVLDPLQEKAFVAVLKDSKIEVHVPSNLTLLKALQSAGFDVPCDCAEGLCGTCEVSVVEGVVDHRDKVLSKAERLQNQRMMSCCSRAIGPTITIAL
jgi:cytochrome P450/ferredoxin-NADP reductase